jgi:hypothetical protein
MILKMKTALMKMMQGKNRLVSRLYAQLILKKIATKMTVLLPVIYREMKRLQYPIKLRHLQWYTVPVRLYWIKLYAVFLFRIKENC